MNIPNECIILGGGYSIQEGIKLGLKEHLKNKFVIVCNYGFLHFIHTLLCFVDRDFYKTRNINKNPDIYDKLKSLPLIVGINHNGIEEFKLPNTILVHSSMRLKKMNKVSDGFYTKYFLTGIFAMSLAAYLMNYVGKIYLLGFDWTKEGNTHYYNKKEINHKGIGYHNHYIKHKSEIPFKPFRILNDIKIYNVSPESDIPNFEKINYNQMFKLLNKEKYNQKELRKEIRNKLAIPF